MIGEYLLDPILDKLILLTLILLDIELFWSIYVKMKLLFKKAFLLYCEDEGGGKYECEKI